MVLWSSFMPQEQKHLGSNPRQGKRCQEYTVAIQVANLVTLMIGEK
jgi:hypothetical protein